MKPNPCRIEASTALDSVRSACRSMVSVITSAAEKKKLKLSKRKQEFAPASSTKPPATLGATISDPCCACDINPFTAISPAIGTSVRTATDCAGTKKAETTLIVNTMRYISDWRVGGLFYEPDKMAMRVLDSVVELARKCYFGRCRGGRPICSSELGNFTLST